MPTMLFRCTNRKCKTTDFESDRPICPGCKVDGNIPKYRGIVQRLQVIHFDPPDEIVYGRGMGYPACNPAKTIAGLMMTGEHRATNCKACMATEAFKTTFTPADDENGLPPEALATVHTVAVDQNDQTIKVVTPAG